MNTHHLLGKFLFIIFCFSAPLVFASDVLQLSSGIREPLSNQQQTGFNDRVSREAFRRIGYDINIQRLPGSRALQDLDDGIIDGDLVRIKTISNIFPNVRRIPVKIIDFDFVAISKKLDFKPDGWSSLKPYEVGIVSGWKILENNVKDTVSRTKVDDTSQLIRILDNDRVDLVVCERWQALEAMKKLGVSMTIHEPPINSNEMFMVVNKKHEKLIPQLTQALEAMKKDGSFTRIYNETLAALAQ